MGLKQPLASSRSKKLLLAGLVGIVVVVAGLELTDTTHIFHTPATKVVVQTGKIAKPADKSSTKTNSQPAKKPSSNNSTGNGGATDTHGAQTSTDSQQWIVSKSGNITVKQPAANATVTSGSIVSGSAKVGEVQYRLIDDSKGVIAAGPISVVNGNFSAKLNFTRYASSGRLDIFSYDPGNPGVEINEVQIGIKL